MTPIVIGLILYLLAVGYRAVFCSIDTDLKDPHFVVPLCICMFANGLAGMGFAGLIAQPHEDGANYTAVLIILSLLTAGVISGKFAFTHHDLAHDEKVLGALMSLLLVILFYTLFGSVSYYAGLTESVSTAPFIYLSIPVIMVLVLIWNTIHDFWDYRAVWAE